MSSCQDALFVRDEPTAEVPKAKWADPVTECVNQCAKIADNLGVVMFSIAIGDDRSYETFTRKENWSKYKARRRIQEAVRTGKCGLHSKYKGMKKPTTKCQECLAIFNAKQKV